MRDGFLIDGNWVAPRIGERLDVIDPATEEVFHTLPAANAAHVDAAVRAARTAFDNGPWPRLSGAERAAILSGVAEEINRRRDELAALEVRDNGKPLPEARWDIDDAAGCFRYYAGLAADLDTERSQPIALGDARFVSKAVKEPLGVAGAIIPWNYPMLMAAWKVAPALAAGCTMVLKPSELTSLTALELGVIAGGAGLPRGVLNIVTGTGREAGAALADHPGVDKLAFTGSVPTGSKIMAAAARDIKRVSLELGGKSPFIVFADSDIDRAVEWIMFGIFWNQGQVCSATSRVLVERPIYRRLLERLAEEARKIRVGNGFDPDVKLGPLVSSDQYGKVRDAILRGMESGGKLVCGGGRPAGFERGYFVEPTVFAEVDPASWIWREEIFGPVLCVRPFDTEAEAITLANDTRFGLAAAVMSADDDRCERVAGLLRAGIVWLNCSQPTFTEAPWGGYKSSGIGRELGRWGLENYLETKQVMRYVSSDPWGWYLTGG